MCSPQRLSSARSSVMFSSLSVPAPTATRTCARLSMVFAVLRVSAGGSGEAASVPCRTPSVTVRAP